jgi:membrane-bound lytic murein transglycosylase MltF
MTKTNTPVIVLLVIFITIWLAFIVFRLTENKHEPDNRFSAITQKGVLTVCGEYDPFGFYTDEHGQHGFHYDLIESFASNYNLDVNYQYEGNFQKRLDKLNAGTVDVLTGPLPIINELKNQLMFTDPIYTSRLVLIQRKSTKPLRNQIELSGKIVTIPSNSPYIYRLQHLSTENSDSIIVSYRRVFNSEELIQLLLDGKIDYTVAEETIAKALQRRFPNIDISTPVGLSQFQAWGVRLNNTALRDSLNRFISESKQQARYQKWYDRVRQPD